MTKFSANENIKDVALLIHQGFFPDEWKDTPGAISDRLEGPVWAKSIISKAKVQLALYLLPEDMQEMMLADETIDEMKVNCKAFEMKKYAYSLTRSMRAEGWKQYQSVVRTKTPKQAEQEGVKHRRYRYAVHFWVAPAGEILLGKLKLEGKHVPPS